MELRLTNEESMNFSREHSEAMLLSMQAIEDYVSARCCIFNNLFTGLTIASQAIEKMLKAIIYMETKQKFKVKGNDRHKPFKLKEELKQAKDYNLDRFDDLLKRLYGYYQARYPDNDDKNKQLLLSDINEIDELWIYLIEIFPAPDEVKYRNVFFSCLFYNPSKRLGYHKWLKFNNKALQTKLPKMKKRYNQVVRHLYPNARKK